MSFPRVTIKNAFHLIVPVVVLGGIFFYAHFAPHTVTVTRTERGFEPSRIYIRKGDTVVFMSKTNKSFWPASDSHPAHTAYPAFDPQKPIPPEGEWRFIFEKPGVWNFHDHMDPLMKGKVVVAGGNEAGIQTCLDGKVADNSLRTDCWEPVLLETLRTKGMEVAFDQISKWYEESPVFRRNCHDIMHLIGAAAYRNFTFNNETVVRPETTYCGYGFYHGFIETMLIEMGDDHFDDIKAYCDALRETGDGNAFGACYHGIGHAVFDSLPSDIWGDEEKMVFTAIGMCESVLTDPWERTQCMSGVSNSLANAMSARDYYLTFTGEHSTDICASLKKEYHPVCYPELAVGYVRDEFMTREESFEFFSKLDELESRGATIIGFMDDEVRRLMASGLDLPELVSFCSSLDTNDAPYCFDGVIHGLFAVGKPGQERVLMRQFCALASTISESKQVCADYVPADE